MTGQAPRAPRTPRAQALRNRRVGADWERAVEGLLQTSGWPNASHITGSGRGDYTGIGDLVLEATTETWANIGTKMKQARDDAQRLGYPRFVVVKRKTGAGVHQGYWVEETGPALQAYRRLEELERASTEDTGVWQTGYDRGYAAGRASALAELMGGGA